MTFPKLDTKSSEELIASAYESGVGAHGERTYDIPLDIPGSTFLPNFSLCTLFEQYVQLTVSIIVAPISVPTCIFIIIFKISKFNFPIEGQSYFNFPALTTQIVTDFERIFLKNQ